MNRRDTVLALAALGASPLAAEAQRAAKPARIAVLAIGSPDSTGYLVDAFKQGLRELGYIEGMNVVVEIRWALGKAERLPDLAKEVVVLNPDVIFVGSTITVHAAHRATTTIPIIMVSGSDPVGDGLVKSLARPGGNITGLSILAYDTSPKLLELLLTFVPRLARVAVLVNPTSPAKATIMRDLQAAAQSVGVNMLSIEPQTPVEIENAFGRMARENARAVIVPADALLFLHRRQIADLAIKNRIPSVFSSRDYVEAGGLMSYGQNLTEQFRRAAAYVDKILKGAKPGGLPIEQATTFELVVNLKTAKALGLTIPQSLLIRADRVIQ